MLSSANRRRFLRQIVGVSFDEYLDGFVAGVIFDPQRVVLEVDFMPPSGFFANNCIGHVHACAISKG